MSKINLGNMPDRSVASTGNHPNAALSYEEGTDDITVAKLQLFTQVASCLVREKRDTLLQKRDTLLLESIYTVMAADPRFILQLAVYARNTLHLRSLPVVLLGEAASNPRLYLDENGRSLITEYTPRIIRRPDEVTELLAYVSQGASYGDQGPAGKMLPNALRRGLERAMRSFDEYQLGHYNRASGGFSMRDALRLVHPRPSSPAQSAMFAYLAGRPANMKLLPKTTAMLRLLGKDELDAEAVELLRAGYVTWQVALSHFGNHKELWEATLRHMGYMDILRNLRNMLNAGVDEDTLCSYITDSGRVKRSRLLPYRFFAAADILNRSGHGGRIQNALAQAFEMAVENAPRLEGKTLLCLDFSASMGDRISQDSMITYKDVASILGAICVARMQADICIFASNAAWVYLRNEDGALTNVKNLENLGMLHDSVGINTLGWRAIALATESRRIYDRIIVLSNMQLYNDYGPEDKARSLPHHLNIYRQTLNQETRCLCVDMGGDGTAQVPPDDPLSLVVEGWTENILTLADIWERSGGILREIERL